MARPDFEKLRAALLETARPALKAFSESKKNKGVYAVAFDAMEGYGTVILSINTLVDLQQSRRTTYSDLPDEQIGGLGGVKYNPGDFGHIDIAPASAELESWSTQFTEYLANLGSASAYQRNLARFSDAIVTAIDELAPELARLDQTDYFIAYHGYHDVTDEVTETLIRKTVDPERFDIVFPEVRQYREFVDGIANASPTEAVATWLSFLEAYAWRRKSTLSAQFYRQRLYLDVQEPLVRIGAIALHQIFELLDRIIYEPQFNEKGSDTAKAEGAFTRFSDVASLLLWTVQEIGVCDNQVEQRMLNYIRRLHELAKTQEDPIGTNMSVATRVLHSLNPAKFPKGFNELGTNRPINISAFLSID